MLDIFSMMIVPKSTPTRSIVDIMLTTTIIVWLIFAPVEKG